MKFFSAGIMHWTRCLREGERREGMGRFTVATIVAFWVASVSIMVDRIVPEPYMVRIVP